MSILLRWLEGIESHLEGGSWARQPLQAVPWDAKIQLSHHFCTNTFDSLLGNKEQTSNFPGRKTLHWVASVEWHLHQKSLEKPRDSHLPRQGYAWN